MTFLTKILDYFRGMLRAATKYTDDDPRPTMPHRGGTTKDWRLRKDETPFVAKPPADEPKSRKNR